MNVNNFTLLADEQQSPGGQEHVNACAQVMGNASHPRRIRFYRSQSINKDDTVSVLPANEAMQITPVIFSSGDGSAQLMEALRSVSADNNNSSMALSRVLLTYNTPPSPPVTSPAQTMAKQQQQQQQQSPQQLPQQQPPQQRQSQTSAASTPSLLRDPSTGLIKKPAAKNPFAPGTSTNNQHTFFKYETPSQHSTPSRYNTFTQYDTPSQDGTPSQCDTPSQYYPSSFSQYYPPFAPAPGFERVHKPGVNAPFGFEQKKGVPTEDDTKKRLAMGGNGSMTSSASSSSSSAAAAKFLPAPISYNSTTPTLQTPLPGLPMSLMNSSSGAGPWKEWTFSLHCPSPSPCPCLAPLDLAHALPPLT